MSSIREAPPKNELKHNNVARLTAQSVARSWVCGCAFSLRVVVVVLKVEPVLVHSGRRVRVAAASIEQRSAEARRRGREVTAVHQMPIERETDDWRVGSDPMRVVCSAVETGIRVRERVAVKVRLTSSLANVLAAAVNLALGRRVHPIVIVYWKERLLKGGTCTSSQNSTITAALTGWTRSAFVQGNLPVDTHRDPSI